MKTASLAILFAPAVFAQGLRQATGGVTPTAPPVPWYPEPTPEVSNCTASLITTLCEYKAPELGTAVASSGYKHCWEYCNAHQPCDFVIFVKGNPYTGTGTCWLYPGEKFDKSLGKEGCDYLSVYDKPVCAANPATPTSGGCAATASPSAVATICDYPTPDDNCWSTCAASSGASNCLDLCAKSDQCNYAVFNPRTESLSPYSSGTCWMYPNGTYDASKAGKCAGKPEQYVYENPCPKAGSKAAASGSVSGSASLPSGTGGPGGATAEGADKGGATTTEKSKGAAPGALTVSGSLAAGVAVLMWQALW
ncbi:hypothetical protein DE146DRAFT_662180 [Phaeosphaeria sp. MPI-PUGE-AT-0046c]|nr:hypothetical protein DE146DRAFT_662180 [Phaeosphaeria sp. MPI-PUGE-AT-0046c]